METNGQRAGISRRDLIKRSAIAGGVAWTAPMVIDSLASPAGAISGSINLNSGISYAIIAFLSGGNLYTVQINGSSCTSANNGSNDTGGYVGTCHGYSFDFNVSASKALAYAGGSAVATYPGSCAGLFTANNNTVTADPSITLVLGLAHAGSCSGNNAAGGSSISKLSIVCANSNTITFNC